MVLLSAPDSNLAAVANLGHVEVTALLRSAALGRDLVANDDAVANRDAAGRVGDDLCAAGGFRQFLFVRKRDSVYDKNTDTGEVFHAERAIVTLPLGVLRAAASEPAAVRFVPELAAKRRALRGMEMGSVIRVTLVFRERFWEGMTRDAEKANVSGRQSGSRRITPSSPAGATRYAPEAACLQQRAAGTTRP